MSVLQLLLPSAAPFVPSGFYQCYFTYVFLLLFKQISSLSKQNY